MRAIVLNAKLDLLVSTASGLVGIRESGPNKGEMIELFQKAVDGKASGEPYCAGFVHYCLNQVALATANKPAIHKSESVIEMWERTPKMCRLEKPDVGSVMCWQFYKNGKPTRAGHCGIVKDVIDESTVLVVEGNTSEPSQLVVREGNGVWLKKRKVVGSKEMKVLGWLLPWA